MSGGNALQNKPNVNGTSTEDRREMQHAALRYDLSTARPLKELVLCDLKNGVRPEWIATKYGHLGVTLERVTAFKAAIDKQKEAQSEREKSARGDRELPEVGQVPDGA